ncbi:MAG: hypothetical protein IJ025_08135 [Clostridia bacterium]|nr:hypothetical protein [Clostridia bacterium]
MAYINIDTKYARRDIERMRKAIAYLDEAKAEYSTLNAMVCETYKGQAANALSDVIVSNRMKKLDSLISDINIAKRRLETAVEDYERLSKEIKDSVSGR